MVLALALAGAVLVVLVRFPFQAPQPADSGTETLPDDDPVRLDEMLRIVVEPGRPLEKKLVVATSTSERLSAPLLTVTGSVVARLGSGKDNPETRWDFQSPELATAYADWLKARAEVGFAEKQLATVRALTKAQVEAQAKLVERLRKLVAAGTDPQKDLAAAEADLLKTQLQGQKDEHEAETAVKNALRNRATLERQLFQAGSDPELLARATEGMAIVVAEVPEAKVSLVTKGQACEARFFAFPGTTFPGRVGSLAPTLARERRTLRVFFELGDPNGRLKPGMFAEIGLGTDSRAVLLVPADAVLHVGQSDYVLVEAETGIWRITEVKVAEAHGSRVQIVSGLSAGERVISKGAILLKPLVVQALQNGKRGSERGARVLRENPTP